MKKNCVILKWNPAISSYHFIDFLSAIGERDSESDWSIYEHSRVKAGDQFFMLKVGSGICGIVAAGSITSNPVPDKDWSGRERKVYYSDYSCNFMVNPETLPVLESSVLEKNIPGFDWYGGHSGVILEDGMAEKLNQLYQTYLKDNAAVFADRFALMARRNMYNDQLYISEELFSGIQG